MNILKKLFGHKLVKAGGWYTVTEFFIKGMMFLTIPIFTRMLSPADYGIQALFTTWSSILSIICGLNLYSSITKAKFQFEDQFDEYVSSISFLSTILFGVFMLIMIIFKSYFTNLFGFDGPLYYILLFYSFFTFISNTMLTKLRVLYKYKGVSILNILIKILGLILAIVLIMTVFKEKGYMGKILGDSTFTILFGVFFLAILLKEGKTFVHLPFWKFALVYSIPLVFHSLANIINNQFDRIIIEQFHGAHQTGLYSFAYSFGAAIFILIHALDLAWSPWSFEQFKAGKEENIRKFSYLYRDVINVALLLIMFLSPEVVRIMASEKYWEALIVVPWILLGYYLNFMYTLEVKVEFYYNKTFFMSIGTVMSALINIALNYIFVPKYGYVAAAITTAFAYLCLFLFHYIMVVFVLKKKLYEFRFHLTSLLYGGLLVAAFYLTESNIILRYGFLALALAYNGWSVWKNYTNLKDTNLLAS